jgi:LacI family transcriptional regulator
MRKRRTTIHDIAKKLGISASTVSRALHDHPRISKATKKAVHKTAERLHYQPNHIAAALRNGKGNVIGIIVPTADRSFFSSVVRGIEEIANAANYNVMICQTHDLYLKEVATVEALLNARVDGIIASIAKETENFDHFRKLKEKGIPLVLFDRSNDELEVSNVIIDDYLGAYKAVEHLVQQGCEKIAHFTSRKKVSIYRERYRGYREALEFYNIAFDESLVLESDLQLEDGRQCMEQLLSKAKVPDGIFSSSDYCAMGALQVLREKGISSPNQIAIVGFSNEPFTSFSEPTISTVDQHSMRMGNAAAEIFLEQILAGNKVFIPKKTVLKPDLIIRKSSSRHGK